MTNKMSLCLKKLKVYASAKLNVVKVNTCILATVNKELTHCFKKASLEIEEWTETLTETMTRDFRVVVSGKSCLDLEWQWQIYNKSGKIPTEGRLKNPIMQNNQHP